MFVNSPTGVVVPISGTGRDGPWKHIAFLPHPLPSEPPAVSSATVSAIGDARAMLAALDARATLLPDPAFLRRATLRVEAQSTSALEGTYAPLETILSADEDVVASDSNVREVVNYIVVAELAFASIGEGHSVTVGLLEDLQKRLIQGTKADTAQAGRIRTTQVFVGSGHSAQVHTARFVPPPPGLELETLLGDWTRWINRHDTEPFDPVVAAAIGHYHFETLHPFNDGNGRLGRLAVVLQLMRSGTLAEPTLSVSPWFEARRPEYYDRLLAVSTDGAWDDWIRFFALGLAESASSTLELLRRLLEVSEKLKQRARDRGLRAHTAMSLIDLAVSRTTFTLRQVKQELGIGYSRARTLVTQLIEAGVLAQYGNDAYNRRFLAPAVRDVLLGRASEE